MTAEVQKKLPSLVMTTSTAWVVQLPDKEVIDALAEQLAIVQEQCMAIAGLALATSSLQVRVLVFRTYLCTL